MDQQLKHQIVDALIGRRQIAGSANKLATQIGISGGQLSTIINKKWLDDDRLVSAEMWARLAAHLGIKKQAWEIVTDLPAYDDITNLLHDAQTQSETFLFIHQKGSCKSEAVKAYATLPGVCLVKCEEHMQKKEFLQKMAQGFGINAFDNVNIGSLLDRIEAAALSHTAPLIILDEMDKVSDGILYFFITLYNRLEDKCGFFACGTPYLQKRIQLGLRLGKKGFDEMFSRFGGRFIKGLKITNNDIVKICQANGITDKKVIDQVITKTWESEDDRNRPTEAPYIDLRRVKRLVKAYKAEQQKQAEAVQPELFNEKTAA